MQLADPRVHTDAVIAALEGFGLVVGDGEAPKDTEPPYVAVYPVPGGGTTGTLANPDDDAFLIYQITCVGVSRQQAEWLEAKALALLGGLQVEGRRIARVALDMHGGIQRDDQAEPPVFYSTPRFRLISTPGEPEGS